MEAQQWRPSLCVRPEAPSFVPCRPAQSPSGCEVRVQTPIIEKSMRRCRGLSCDGHAQGQLQGGRWMTFTRDLLTSGPGT